MDCFDSRSQGSCREPRLLEGSILLHARCKGLRGLTLGLLEGHAALAPFRPLHGCGDRLVALASRVGLTPLDGDARTSKKDEESGGRSRAIEAHRWNLTHGDEHRKAGEVPLLLFSAQPVGAVIALTGGKTAGPRGDRLR